MKIVITAYAVLWKHLDYRLTLEKAHLQPCFLMWSLKKKNGLSLGFERDTEYSIPNEKNLVQRQYI